MELFLNYLISSQILYRACQFNVPSGWHRDILNDICKFGIFWQGCEITIKICIIYLLGIINYYVLNNIWQQTNKFLFYFILFFTIFVVIFILFQFNYQIKATNKFVVYCAMITWFIIMFFKLTVVCVTLCVNKILIEATSRRGFSWCWLFIDIIVIIIENSKESTCSA